MLIDQISIFVANQPGRLTDVTSILFDAGVDIRALSLADTTDFGILRLIVSDHEKTEKVLKEKGLTVRRTKVIAAKMDDRPGALHRILKILTERDIAVEYAYAFITPKGDDACVILRVEENDVAVAALLAGGITLLTEKDIRAL